MSGVFDSLAKGVGDLLRRKEVVGRLEPRHRLDGQWCLVTGASSGLGRAVARQMAERGARVVLAARRPIEELGEGEESTYLDLLRFDSIVHFVDELAARKLVFDVVVFNAGIVAREHRLSPEGYDEMLQVNCLSKVLLTRLLLDRGLVRGAEIGKARRLALPGIGPAAGAGGDGHSGTAGTEGSAAAGTGGGPPPGAARLILVSSEIHRNGADPVFPEVMSVEPYTMASSMHVYGYSKLLLTTFTEELARRVSCSVLALCPGAMNTNIAREAPAWTRPLLKVVFAILFRSARKAAEPVLLLAASPAFDGSTGDYLHLLERKAKDPRALDPALGRRLWEATEDLLRPWLPAT